MYSTLPAPHITLCILAILGSSLCKDTIKWGQYKRNRHFFLLSSESIFDRRSKLANYPTCAKKMTKKFGEYSKKMYLCSVIQGNSQKGWQPLWPSGRFEPQIYEPSLFGGDGFVLWEYLGNRDTILYQVLIGTLKADSQFDILILHDQQLFKLLLISRIPLGW